jgi:L-ascorbate metabolism protein UlaG (beta-lactamase superfamily)
MASMQWIKKGLKGLVKLLLFLIIFLSLLITVLPSFLDHIYYQGPKSSHYDGERFFNPDGDDVFATPPTPGAAAAEQPSRLARFWRFATRQGRPPWPESVPVAPVNARALPALKTGEMRATWVGHSTLLIETPGFAMLTDPVWEDAVGPFGIGPGRVTQPGIAMADLPKIDLIIISHSHYDHMGLETLGKLWVRDKPRIVVSLGNDAIVAQSGAKATALDWGQHADIGKNVRVHVTRNHHWGSRWGSDRNRSLWSSFVVDTPSGSLFFGGDTGLGDGKWPGEAAAVAARPIRFAMIPIGAFRFGPGMMGTGSHIGPQDAVRVWNRLGRPHAMGIHWGTFRLSNEAYDTPPKMLELFMRCTKMPANQFSGWTIGVPQMIPAYRESPAVDEAQLDDCAKNPEITALK